MKKNKPYSLSPGKAVQILFDGNIRGHELTTRQKKFFGTIASGGSKKKKS